MNENKTEAPDTDDAVQATQQKIDEGPRPERDDLEKRISQQRSALECANTQETLDKVKADIEQRIGGDLDKTASDEDPSYPQELLVQVADQEATAGTGVQWGGSVCGDVRHFFKFIAGGPVYQLSEDRPAFCAVTDKALIAGAMNLLDEMGTETEVADGHEDEFDSPYDDDYEPVVSEANFLAELDEIILPRMITAEDLAAADLEDGPGFTHAEALLAALCAADAVAADADMDEDMAEALYEFAEKAKWEVQPETLYRHAMSLLETEPEQFHFLDVDLRHWFLTFTHVGKVMAGEARMRKADYVGKLETLKREIERTRSQRKLADRKAEKQAKREQRPVLLKRAADRWRKNQKKNEARAEKARRRGSKPAR